MEQNEFLKMFSGKNIKDIEKSNFYEYLSVMLDGWVSIATWLRSVLEKVKNNFFKESIAELIVFVTSWDSLSKSMKKLPDTFTSWEISIIEAWEKSWTLVDSFETLSGDYKKIHNLVSKIKWALTYPLIILVFLVIAILVVMTYVIPAIKPLFDESDAELPAATQALIWSSDFVVNNFYSIIFLFVIIGLSLKFISNTDSWKNFFDRLLLDSPLIWDVYRNYILTRVSANLGTLMWAGVPILKALSLVWKSTNNFAYEEVFDMIRQEVSKWKKIVESILEVDRENKFFPSDFLQMLSVWEKTASINKISKKMNAQYTKEVDNSLSNLTKWIEPTAILIAWLFVLWFAFAIFGAILEMTQTIG